MISMTAANRRWLDALWPFVRTHLPPAPASVLEIGCGQAGGFVPAMREQGYDAVGVDPLAPSETGYYQTDFERHVPTSPVAAIVACTSLHHVGDLHDVLDHAKAILVPGGTLIVIEWAYERFDETTARWCFDRLTDTGEAGWLQHHRQQWVASGQPWHTYRDACAQREHLHTGQAIIEALQARFGTRLLSRAPYFFPDLHPPSETNELTAATAGEIQATGIRFVSS